MNKQLFFGMKKYVIVPLLSADEDIGFNDPNAKKYEFTSERQFSSFIMSEIVYDIFKQADAYWLDDGEIQVLDLRQIAIALPIIEKAIAKKKYYDIHDCLSSIADLMKIAMEVKTCIIFRF